MIQEKDDGGCVETAFCQGEGCGGLKMDTKSWIPLPTERGGLGLLPLDLGKLIIGWPTE